MTPPFFEDLRAAASRRVPAFLFHYVDGGSGEESALRRNAADLDAIALRQRVLRDVSAVSTAATLWGRNYAMPVGLAPVGLAGMHARRGEVQAARAAAAVGVPFTLSTVSACALEEVARGCDTPAWFQLYVMRDRGFMRDLLDRAEAAGCHTLLLTVDMAVPGIRRRDFRTGLTAASGWRGQAQRVAQAMARPRWAWDVGLHGRPHALGNVAPLLGGRSGIDDFFAWMRDNFDPSVTWEDVAWIRSRWRGRLAIKGVLDPDDAARAVDAGADGVVVSNHGGRQLDAALSTARALPAVADAVAGRAAVLADGGVRSGTDVARLLALGADFVMLGRAWVYALGAGGGPMVEAMLRAVQADLRVAMALSGCARVSELDRALLAR